MVSLRGWITKSMLKDCSESMQEAEDNMHRLVELVEGLVDSNTDLKKRLDDIAADHASGQASTSLLAHASSHATSPPVFQQEFEEDLNSSRVYRNLRPRSSIYSINSSSRASLALSAFSDLSLGNVSVVSVMCLPVWSVDLTNAEHYRFGREGLTLTLTELAEQYPQIEFPDSILLDDIDENSLHCAWSDSELYSGSSLGADTGAGLERGTGINGRNTPTQSTSGRVGSVFSSARPIDFPSVFEQSFTTTESEEILFMAASLFDFNIGRGRSEGGIPYLVYVPGEASDFYHIFPLSVRLTTNIL
jgi:hypothetical protein